MESRLQLDILAQPDNVTCGPTCLHAVYRFYGDQLPLDQVIQRDSAASRRWDIGCFAGVPRFAPRLRRDHFDVQSADLRPDLVSAPISLAWRIVCELRWPSSGSSKLACGERGLSGIATDLGGRIQMEDFTSRLIRRYLKREIPILTGLSATYLYRRLASWSGL
jgi:hypothetical protein